MWMIMRHVIVPKWLPHSNLALILSLHALISVLCSDFSFLAPLLLIQSLFMRLVQRLWLTERKVPYIQCAPVDIAFRRNSFQFNGKGRGGGARQTKADTRSLEAGSYCKG